jgi:hypothetical protein
MDGNSTEAVTTTESMTRAAITEPVNRLVQRPFTQEPSTALSLHNSNRNCCRWQQDARKGLHGPNDDTKRRVRISTSAAAAAIRPHYTR